MVAGPFTVVPSPSYDSMVVGPFLRFHNHGDRSAFSFLWFARLFPVNVD